MTVTLRSVTTNTWGVTVTTVGFEPNVEAVYRVRVEASNAAEALLKVGDILMIRIGDDTITEITTETGTDG